MQASLPVAAELGLLYFITIKHVNMAMFPIPFHPCALRDLIKSPCPPVKLRAYPGKFPSSRANMLVSLHCFHLE